MYLPPQVLNMKNEPRKVKGKTRNYKLLSKVNYLTLYRCSQFQYFEEHCLHLMRDSEKRQSKNKLKIHSQKG